jgi:hypothetical protein
MELDAVNPLVVMNYIIVVVLRSGSLQVQHLNVTSPFLLYAQEEVLGRSNRLLSFDKTRTT